MRATTLQLYPGQPTTELALLIESLGILFTIIWLNMAVLLRISRE